MDDGIKEKLVVALGEPTLDLRLLGFWCKIKGTELIARYFTCDFFFLFIRLPQYNRRLFNIPNVSHKPDKVFSSDFISHPSDTNIATCFTTKTDGLVPRL